MTIQFTTISPDQVRNIHDLILATEPGRLGETPGYLEGALNRVETAHFYERVEDLFELAAHYARAIGQGHCFTDANKRTGLVTCLTFLKLNGFIVERNDALEDAMVDLTTGDLALNDFADLLYSLTFGIENDPDEEDAA